MTAAWQDIGTAQLGHRMEILCFDEDGSEVVFSDAILLDDEPPYAFDHDGGTYYPHQNGMEAKGWRPSPPSKEGE